MDALLVAVFLCAFIYEIIDSSIGQGYGTLGTPTYILIGLNAYYIIPCVLLSQAVGGIIGGIAHHQIGNYDLRHNHIDRANTALLVIIGVVGVFIGVYGLSRIPSLYLNTYIGILVIAVGTLIVLGIHWKYSKLKMFVVSLFASFNKGFSGGGYGPVATGGQIAIGSNTKNAIGVTTIAEAPICITGFIVWCLLNHGLPQLDILLAMCFGAGLAPLVGAKLTALGEQKAGRKMQILVGIVIVILGISTLWKVFGK